MKQTVAQRTRSILLSYGEPLPLMKLVTALKVPKPQVINALKELEEKKQVQVGAHGWRAL